MKRVAIWAVYIIGTIAVIYLALYAYRVLTAPRLKLGPPIEIYRDEDAPKFS